MQPPQRPHRSKNSHAFENMVEHIFLADLLKEMWFNRGQVIEVSKADVDSWGYDVVLSNGSLTRYVQLKTSVPADVTLRLFRKPAACVVAAVPKEKKLGVPIQYRLWEVPKNATRAARDLPVSEASVYKRGETKRAKREGHRRVNSSSFSMEPGIASLAAKLFP